MKPEHIKYFRELCEKATPGPWKPLLNSKGLTGIHAEDCQIYHALFDPQCLKETHNRQKSDAKFIAESRTAIPKLLDEIEVLTADVDGLEEKIIATEDRSNAMWAVVKAAKKVQQSDFPLIRNQETADNLKDMHKALKALEDAID